MLAKQVLSQLSYTPTKTTLILNHLSLFRIPSFAKIVVTVPNKLGFPVGACARRLDTVPNVLLISSSSGLSKSGP
jgi:hypothetical protein